MKAERRHDLKTNTLVRELELLPELWKKYGQQALLVVVAIVLVLVLIRYRLVSAETRRDTAAKALSDCQQMLDTLKSSEMSSFGANPIDFASRRSTIATDLSTQINAVIDDLGNNQPRLKAQAM